MLDIGWTELLVIGVVALIVVGPKDLPGMFRTLGRFTGKLRGMARDFQRAMDDAARETGVKDVASDLKKATSPRAMGLDALNSAADRFEKWDPTRGVPRPKPATPAATAAGGMDTAMGPATAALSEERKAAAAAVQAASAERVAARTPSAAEPPVAPGAVESAPPKDPAA
jgi:sec-independent protein translocase protein TatB